MAGLRPAPRPSAAARRDLPSQRRRVDALREQGRLVERPPDVTFHFVEQRVQGRGIGVWAPPGELHGGRQGDQVLLHAAVQFTLDRPAVGIGGQDEPL